MMSIQSTIRPIANRFLSQNANAITKCSPMRNMTVLSKSSAEEYKKQNYTERMNKTNRPVSPHVTIYSFPITALSSITNRVTGCALSIGAAGVAMLELTAGSGSSLALMESISTCSNGVLVSGAKFTVAFPLVYHYLGGVRHLIWDNIPDMLTNVDVEKASYVLVGSSLVLSAGMAVV